MDDLKPEQKLVFRIRRYIYQYILYNDVMKTYVLYTWYAREVYLSDIINFHHISFWDHFLIQDGPTFFSGFSWTITSDDDAISRLFSLILLPHALRDTEQPAQPNTPRIGSLVCEFPRKNSCKRLVWLGLYGWNAWTKPNPGFRVAKVWNSSGNQTRSKKF